MPIDKYKELLCNRYTSGDLADQKLPGIPKHITDNLAHTLRPYQEEAVRRWLHFVERPHGANPIELLFNMATGSGKTTIMAALILDLYHRGYRNFIYFVNSTNIIEKTRDNFTNPASKKYLFSTPVVIDGKQVEIHDVASFSQGATNSINIVFTTIQSLHNELNVPHENHLTLHDFEQQKVALIGDEAHHNNSRTLLNKADLAENRSWEATISAITRIAKEPILLEFTATIDLEDSNIRRKYRDRILYRYDLRHFRADGYSKDVLIYHVDSDVETRMLQAIIISQYRQKVALRHGIWLKPVVLFKSRTIAENKQNYESFCQLISKLTPELLAEQKSQASSLLAEAFQGIDLSLADLASELKNDFLKERLLLVDGNTISRDKQISLNSLEDEDNGYRAIFAVDMLNEGWDVLNLFDIVRLYDTRDARNNHPGKTTMREAQLIGRGARYYPFIVGDAGQKYIRKFDNNESEPLRLLEQLHYHSANNPKYIQELRQALITSGLIDEDYIERTLHLKNSFKRSRAYRDSVVYFNERRPLPMLSGLQDLNDSRQTFAVQVPSQLGAITAMFDESASPAVLSGLSSNAAAQSAIDQSPAASAPANVGTSTSSKPAAPISTTQYRFTFGAEIDKNLIRYAMSRNKAFRFDQLQTHLPNLRSADEFMDQLGKLSVAVSGVDLKQGQLTAEQKVYIASSVLSQLEAQMVARTSGYIGTKTFRAQVLAELFPSQLKRKYYRRQHPSDPEYGLAQTLPDNVKYALFIADKPWYIYDENYGASTSKALVLAVDDTIDFLTKYWQDIYLLPNVKKTPLYTFENGRSLISDYLLIAHDLERNLRWQIFLKAEDTKSSPSNHWQDSFLSQIQTTIDDETGHTNIIGLSFYDEPDAKRNFIGRLRHLASSGGF